MSDFDYRTVEEVNEWKDRDPIEQLANAAVAAGEVNEAELAAIADDVQKLVEADIARAEGSSWPGADRATEHVFANE